MADGREQRERSKRRDDRGRSRDRRRRRRDDEEEDANRAKLVPARAPSPPPPKHPPRGAAPKGKAREKNEETDDDSEGEESSGGEPDMEVETTVPGKKEAKLAADNDDKAAKANKRSASAVAEDPRLLPEPKGSDGAGDGKRGRSQPAGGAGGKPPPKAKKSDKLMIKDDSQTDEDRTSSYNCDVCGRYVGGGAAGRYQHLRSPFHLSCQLWQSGKYQTWNAAKQKAHKMSEELWANKDSLYSGPQHGNQGSDKSSKMKQKTAPPVVDRVELDRDRHKKPPDDQDGDGHGPGSGSSLLLQMWQKTVEMLR